MADESKELKLLNNVENRIVFAGNDAALQNVLKLYLCPMLLKLNSSHEKVREKTISICQHVNTRIKAASIQLPVSALLVQYQAEKSALLRNFDLMYIQRGIDVMSVEELQTIFPNLLLAFMAARQKTLFHIVLRVLAKVKIPDTGTPEAAIFQAAMDLESHRDESSQLITTLTNFILLVPGTATAPASSPGLTPEEYDFLTSTDPLPPVKDKILKLMQVAGFADEDLYVPYIVAAGIPSYKDFGENAMKKMNMADLPKSSVDRLSSLYTGIPSQNLQPVSETLRIRILAVLQKSLQHLDSNQIRHIVEDGLLVPESNPRFRNAVFEFIMYVTRIDSVKEVAPSIVDKLREFLTIEDRASPLRARAFTNIGLLCRRHPELIMEDSAQLLRFLFSSLTYELRETKISVEEAINTLLPSLVLGSAERDELRELLLETVPDAIDLTVKIANRGLGYDDLGRIWINLLAISSASEKTIEQGKKGLHPYWYRVTNPRNLKQQVVQNPERMDVDSEEYNFFAFPQFEKLLQYLTSRGKPLTKELENAMDHDEIPIPIFVETVSFLKSVIFMNVTETMTGDTKITVDEDWDIKVTNNLATSRDLRLAYKAWLAEHNESMQRYLTLLMEDAQTCEIVSELLPLLPQIQTLSLVEQCKSNDWSLLRSLVQGDKRHMREKAGYLLGALYAEDARNGNNVQKYVIELADVLQKGVTDINSLNHGDRDLFHGSLICLASLLRHLNIATPSTAAPLKDNVDKDRLKTIIESYILVADSRDSMLVDTAMTGLIDLSQHKIVQAEDISASLIEKLTKLGKTGNEKAVLLLGALSLAYSMPSDDITKIKESLFSIHDNKLPELNFATGEALAVMAAGWEANVMKRKMDVENGFVADASLSDRGNGSLLKEILDEVLAKKGGSVSARKAACVWLLSLLQFCGEHLRDRFEEIHSTFMIYLSDRDDFVQESASRGLTHVYELGNQKMKDELVRSLMASLTGGAKSLAGQVRADTQLFEPGALPTGDGSVSTYKDIMSLAAEVGDPGLVYKFMSMASHSAMWTSRAVIGRFGLGSIMSEEMLSENPKLYAKLFRYRFDPNPNVQKAMNDLWSSLVKENVIEKYYDDIMEDLLKSIVDKEWRVREASCSAIADLVQGRPLPHKYIEQIWQMAFKVMDDIKTSVREAAMKLSRVLTTTLVRSLEAGKAEGEVLSQVIPFLTGSSGLEAQAEEVQMFALDTILKLVKKGGGSLQPYIPELVEKLLGLLSSLEPQAINYLYLNATKYKLTEEKIDQARLSSVRTSPMMDAIERAVDIANEATFAELVPRIRTSIKKAVGMPSKVGCSRLLVTLVVRHGLLFRQYANDVLKSVVAVMLDINDTVSSSYASAAGYLCRLADEKAVLNLVETCKDFYFNKDERARGIAGQAIYAISKHASEKFHSIASAILPFVFVAKNDSQAAEFQKTWSENTGGSGAVKLYLSEIVTLATPYLKSNQWSLKETAARSIGGAAKAIGADISEAQCNTLWSPFEQAMAGKSWKGKEDVFDNFMEFVQNAPSAFVEPHKDEIMKIIKREVIRKNMDYRVHTKKTLDEAAEKKPELFKEVHAAVNKFLDEEEKEDEE